MPPMFISNIDYLCHMCCAVQFRFASAVGYPIEKDPDRDFYIGADAMQKRAALNLKWPVQDGVVSDRYIWMLALRG